MSDQTIIDDATLHQKIFIDGYIRTMTGLHIGGSNLGLGIGGADSIVVRNPYNFLPYIPGSSLKGKMRSLLERLEGKIGIVSMGAVKFGPYTKIEDTTTYIPRIFGVSPPDDNKEKETNPKPKPQPVSRLIVRDCHLIEDSIKQLEKMKTADMPFTEVKTEVVIDRITSRAMPRQIERVPAGAIFKMRLVLNVFKMDKDYKPFLDKVFESLTLVQEDYLGGKGTRGSGEVSIKIESVSIKDRTHYEANSKALVLTNIDIPEALQEF